MEDLIKFLAQEITGVEDVTIAATEQDGITIYTVTLPKENIGQFIGKSGRIISAIRTVTGIRAAKENIRFNIEVAEKA
ncbi:KH domain-containing protein [Candidatus Microgenomates bacterium]|nr:KH domain-containing protein [Candidatus Microgenomates bacterium]